VKLPTWKAEESSDGSASSLETPAGASAGSLQIYLFWSSETNTCNKAEANDWTSESLLYSPKMMLSSFEPMPNHRSRNSRSGALCGWMGWLDGKVEVESLGFPHLEWLHW